MSDMFGKKGRFWNLDHFYQKFQNTIVLYDKTCTLLVRGLDYEDDCDPDEGSSYTLTGILYRNGKQQSFTTTLDDPLLSFNNFIDGIGGFNDVQNGMYVGASVKRNPCRHWKQGVCTENTSVTSNTFTVKNQPSWNTSFLAQSLSKRLSSLSDGSSHDELSFPDLMSRMSDKYVNSVYWNGILFCTVENISDTRYNMFFGTGSTPVGLLGINRDGSSAEISMMSPSHRDFKPFLDDELSFAKLTQPVFNRS